MTTTVATFLMTDIEGSTRLWEERADVMPAALETHDGILRDAVNGQGGQVIKTTGDGFLARFEDPEQAIAAAVAAQRALAAQPWPLRAPLKVRMALHTGSAQARDDDYFGPALNRVARLLAIGHGGQVLLSGVTASIAGDRIPDDVELWDRGDHRLRDLDQPEHVYQLVAAGLTREFPPLRSQGSTLTNLPTFATSFVGRERELADVQGRIAKGRLVTLIGTGGTGKTRLMLESAAGFSPVPRDGVWLTELAPVADPDEVPREVARALGVRDQPQMTIEDGLIDFLRAKELVLLLDNCEHVIGAAADLADRILGSCPGVRLLASSREALGVAGETVVQVPSLTVPATADAPHPHAPTSATDGWFEAVTSSGAVRLFVDRAQAVQPDFAVTPANATVVADICRRLDGIPLAIELAAARVTVLSVDEILQRLGDRFRLLTGGRRTAVPRQQTLQALIDWSWDLLAEEDRRLLRRLSVFSGGWTLEAAEAICADGSASAAAATAATPAAPPATGPPLDVLDGLGRLVERSMVVVDRGRTSRYRLLETIRQYATDRLLESGEMTNLRSRHLAYFQDVAAAARDEARGPNLVAWLTWMDTETDNIRAAIEWAVEADPVSAGAMCLSLAVLWRAHSSGVVGAYWMGEVVARLRVTPPVDPTDVAAVRARDVLAAGLLAEYAFARAAFLGADGRPEAEEAEAIARRVDDRRTLILALSSLSTARYFAGSMEGYQEIAEEGIRLAEDAQDWWTLALAEASLANTFRAGDPLESGPWMQRAAEHARLSGSPFAIAFVALTRARILGYSGRLEEARAAFDEAAPAYAEMGDERFTLVTRSDLGHVLRAAGQLDEAEAIYREVIVGWEHMGSRGAIANLFEVFALIAVRKGDGVRAATLFGAAEVLREASGNTMMPWERVEYDAGLVELRATYDAVILETAWAAGRAMDQRSAVAFAVSGDPQTGSPGSSPVATG